MSIQAMTWVLNHSPVKGADRLVMLAIASHAGQSPVDEAWEAWPGVETIQFESRLDRKRTVNDALARLIVGGHLERIVNGAPDMRIRGDHRPNLYRIIVRWDGMTCRDRACFCHRVTRDAARDDVSSANGVTFDDATGCRETSSEPLVNPQIEPSLEPAVVSFDRFWDAYPRKDEKKRAVTAFAKATQRADVETIVAAAATYAADPNRMPQFTKQAPTWLNGDCWNDPPLPSRTAARLPASEVVNAAAAKVAARRESGHGGLFALPTAN